MGKIAAPPPKLKLSEWAETFRFLSSESSSEPGKFNAKRAPYQLGIMDAISDFNTEQVVLMMASQTGKTEIINNAVGFYIHQDPSPILLVQPTLDMAESWSKDRLTPMVRDTPSLNNLIRINLKRDGTNTLLHKVFPGGHITIAGSNSPASLASRPIRILFLDEIDRYPPSAGREGDPVNLAVKRTTNFHNRKIIKASTPTLKGSSRIEVDYENSDKRKYYCPCPQCGEFQVLQWSQVKWDEEPEQAYYVCVHNGCIINDTDKQFMLLNGEWRASTVFKGIAGFHLSALYSPWVSFASLATKFVEAKKLKETLKVFVNTELAETFDDDMEGEGIDEESIIERVEDYKAAPDGVLVITAGVDIQDDRIELEIVGWGEDEESWSLEYNTIYGSPASKAVWQELDDHLEKAIPHQTLGELKIKCACIDSGGHHTEEVYLYCKNKYSRGKKVYPVKGISQPGRPIIGKVSRNNVHKVRMFPVGTDTAKDTIFSRLKITDAGAGYCHFPAHYEDEYFLQLTSEKVVTRYNKGRTTKQYVKKSASRRNEALDCRVYATAALKILNPQFNRLKQRLRAVSNTRISQKIEEQETAPPTDNKTIDNSIKPVVKKPAKSRNKGGFVNSWRK